MKVQNRHINALIKSKKKEMFNIENEVMHQVLIFKTILAPIVAAVVQVVKQTVTIPNNIFT
ncbi:MULTISPECIES: hypothetical protein [unclassified Peribacillus]|uniref:hypothetical protein n=1 Tax=unclassified Peribacillus TaxID=2675266 RepID=UPI0028685DD0|nr:hypothetical protein [Peribacillus sp. R9-11]WMX57504.1 hypothetical protein RE409_09935 [Peribacillus sp. R9-11]